MFRTDWINVKTPPLFCFSLTKGCVAVKVTKRISLWTMDARCFHALKLGASVYRLSYFGEETCGGWIWTDGFSRCFLHGFEVKVSGYKKVPESKVEIMWKVTKQFTPKPPDSSHFLHHFRGNLNLKLQPLCFPFHTSNVWSLALGVNDLFP